MEIDYANISSNASTSGSELSQDTIRLEEFCFENDSLHLPQDLCENKSIFKEFFSLDAYQDCFTEQQKQYLKSFLPSFPENNEEEKDKTLTMLFSNANLSFGNPLIDFHEQLQNGNFTRDISKLRSSMTKARHKSYKLQRRRYYSRLLKDLLISRESQLQALSCAAPDEIPRVDNFSKEPLTPQPRSTIEQRVKKRYFMELEAIRQEVGESDHSSEDDNYPDGPPPKLTKKQRRQIVSLECSLSSEVDRVTSTLASKPSGLDLESNITFNCNPYEITEDHCRNLLLFHKRRKMDGNVSAELNTKGITLSDILQRFQISKHTANRNGHRAPSEMKYHSAKKKSPVRIQQTHIPIQNNLPDRVSPQVGNSSCGEEDSSDESEILESDDDIPSLSSTPIASIEDKQEIDVGEPEAPKPQPLLKSAVQNKQPAVQNKQPAVQNKQPSSVSIISGNQQQAVSKTIIASQPQPVPAESSETTNSPTVTQPVSTASVPSARKVSVPKLANLDNVDLMNLPVDIDSRPLEPLDTTDSSKMVPELMQETHACFFSLIRDVICSTVDHRMSLADMEEQLKIWQGSPISPLNHWYSLAPDTWLQLLHSAINFLSGDYPDVQPDEFVPYLEYKPALSVYQWIGAGRDTDNHLTQLCQHWLDHREEMESRPLRVDDLDDVSDDRCYSPPPPRCPTSWVVRTSTSAERETFRKQERLRYENPHRAFTYHMHGFESVVGPVKGVYNQSVVINKPRGHSLLVTDRPNYVTILALVRDATARLPNGEGTRSDICELLKDSQYLAPITQESYLHSVVSGALDRLHYEPDPCVKYDTKRKIWIYLHRGRNEEEFERIHREYQGILKSKKTALLRKAVRKPKDTVTIKDTSPSRNTTQSKVDVSVSSSNSVSNTAIVTTTAASLIMPQRAKTIPAVKSYVSGTQIVSSTSSNVQLLQTAGGTVVAGKSLLTSSVSSAGTRPSISTSNMPLQQIQTITNVRSHSLLTSAATSSEVEPSKDTTTSSGITISAPVSATQLKSLPQNITNAAVTVSSTRPSQVLVAARNSPATGAAAKTLMASGITGMKLINTVKTITGSDGTQTIYIKPQQQQKVSTSGDQQSQPQQIFQKQAKAAVAQLQQLQQQQLKQIQQQQQSQNIAAGTTTPLPQQRIVTGVSVLNQGQAQQRVVARVAGKPVAMSPVTVTSHQLQQNVISTVQAVTPTCNTTTTSVKQPPVVAKVLTNAQGQVISMESLLAHQKQHGSLPQGTALRVTSAKPGQTSLIQIPTTTPGGVPQFAVVSQGNLISVTQPRVIHTQLPSQPATQQTQTSQQQLQVQAGPRLVNAHINKNFVGTAASTNIRTLTPTNAQSINLAHIGGKPILLASKGQPNSVQGASGQITSSPQTVVLAASQAIRTQGGTLVLQQGGTQQIILPQGFQAGTLNIKTLQGLQGIKVIPLTQGAPVPGKVPQQVYARIINPNIRTATSNTSAINIQSQVTDNVASSTSSEVTPSPTTTTSEGKS